jgi:hypothetical protein
MIPKCFEEQNVMFAKDQPEYLPLPAFKQGNGDVITCWHLTDEEIDKLTESRSLYLSVKTFNQPLQPVYLTVDKTDLFPSAIKTESDEQL